MKCFWKCLAGTVTLLVIAAAVTSCHPEASGELLPHKVSGELPPHAGADKKPLSPITEITLQQVPGLSPLRPFTCYTLILKNSGEATLISAWMPEGTFHSHITASQYTELANELSNSGFFTGSANYGSGALDIPYINLSAVRRSKRRVITDSGEPMQFGEVKAPRSLRLIEKAMGDLVTNCHWVKTSKASYQPNYADTLSAEMAAELAAMEKSEKKDADLHRKAPVHSNQKDLGEL